MPDKNILQKLKEASQQNPDFGKDKSSLPAMIPMTGKSAYGVVEGAQFSDRYEKLGERLGLNPFSSPEYLEKQAYLNQSAGSVVANMLIGGAINTGAGILDSIAAWDLEGVSDMALGNTEKEYGNWLNDITKNVRDWNNKENPIYQDGTSMWNGAYWANQGMQLGYSVGIILESIAEQALLSAVTAGTFGAGSGVQATSALSKLRLIKTLGNAGHGLFKGVQEGYINGMETYNNINEKYLGLGYSKEKAHELAAKGATIGYRAEVGPLMLLNSLQFATIGRYNPFGKGGIEQGYSGAFSSVVDKLIPNVKNKFAKGAVGYGVNIVAEGLEEGIQTSAGNYAGYEIDSLTGENNGKTLGDYIWTHELRDSVIGGMIGGAAFKGFFDGYNSLTKGTQSKVYSEAHKTFIDASLQRAKDDVAAMKKAVDSGDPLAIQRQRHISNKNNTLSALRLDYINGKESAFEAHLGQMETILDAAEKGNLETLKIYGLDTVEDINYVKENYPQFIADSQTIKENLIKNVGNSLDYDAGERITFLEQDFNILNSMKDQINKEFQETLAKDSVYNQLSSEAKQRFQNKAEYSALALVDESTLTPTQLERKQELQETLDSIKVEGQAISNEEFLFNALDTTSYVQQMLNIQKAERGAHKKAKDLAYWKDNKNQAKEQELKLQKVLDEKINTTTSLKALEDLKAKTKANGTLTKEQEEKINVKIDIAKIEEQDKTEGKTPEDPPALATEIPVTNPNTERANNYESILGEDGNPMAVVVDEDAITFEPLSVEDKNNTAYQDTVKKSYDSMTAELGRNPTFTEMILDVIQNHSKDVADKLFNRLAKGWELNGYKKENFEKIYNDLFYNRKQGYLNLLSDVEQMVPNTLEEVQDSGKKAFDDAHKNTARPVAVNEIDNQPILETKDPLRVDNPHLRAAHLSIAYDEVVDEDGNRVLSDASEDLLEASDVNSIKLLDPDLFNEGEKLTVKIPENVDDIAVTHWIDDVTKAEHGMTFGRWRRENNVEPGTPEYYAKVPMIAYDKDGEPVFFVHDTEWYNPTNVALVDGDVKKQAETIFEARNNAQNFRDSVANGTQEIEITLKRMGTWKTIPSDSPAITINQANPQTQIGVANNSGEILVNGEPFEGTIINKTSFTPGNTYQIRRGTTKDTFIALEVLRDPLSEEARETVKQGVRVYLLQKHAESSTEMKSLRNKYLAATGLDLFDRVDFEKFLRLYIKMSGFKVESLKDIARIMNSTKIQSKGELLPTGTPYFMVQRGSLVIGTVRQKLSGNNEMLYIHPEKVNDKNGLSLINSMLAKLDSLVDNAIQSTDNQALSANQKMANISSQREVTPIGNYENYLRDAYKTNVKSFNVGTQENPKYATVIQPVIEFKATGQQGSSENLQTREVASKTKPEEKPQVNVVVEQATETIPETLLEAGEVVTQEPTVGIDKEVLIDSLQQLRALGVSESDPSILYIKEQLGMSNNNPDYDPVSYSDEQVKKMKEFKAEVEGVGIIQTFQLVDYIFNQISSKISFKKGSTVDKKQVFDLAKEKYEELVQPLATKNEILIKTLTAVYEANPEANAGLKVLIDTMQKQGAIFNTIKNNWKVFQDKAEEKLKKYTGITETKNTLDDDTNTAIEEDALEADDIPDQEKNHNKISLEENGKQTASYRLKRFLSDINETKPNGDRKLGFLGIPTYVGFDTAYNTIERLMSSPHEIESNFDLMMLRLEENIGNYPWLREVVDRLKNAETQLQNEFVYNFNRHTLSMKFVMFSESRDGTWSLKVYDTNSTEIGRVIREQWKTSFKNSSLVKTENGEYRINKDRAKVLYEEYKNWKNIIESQKTRDKDISSITNADLQSWLMNFGIYLSNESLVEIRERGLKKLNNKKGRTSLHEMFKESPTSEGIFGLLGDYLNKISTVENTEFEDNEINHPFTNINNVLKTLASTESKYALYATTNSFRDGDKSIYGFTPTKNATDVANKLKYQEEYRAQLKEKSFNKHSFILDLLERDEEFREKFYIDHLGITALKQLGKNVKGSSNDITSLSNSDHELTKLGLFQDVEQGDVKKFLGSNNFIALRMARMFFPTMSDKSQMMDLFTAVMDLKAKHFTESLDIHPELYEVLFSQLVAPELERIHTFNTSIKETNIVGYDTAAQMFILLPALNNIKDAKGNRAIAMMATNPEKYNMEWFKTFFKSEIYDVINQTIQTKADKKVNEWHRDGFITKGDVKDTYNINFLNNKYFAKKDLSKNDEGIKIAALDYVINNLVATANVHMVFAGDPALYAGKKLASYFQDNKGYSPKTLEGNQSADDTYVKVIRDVLGVELGKRLALLLTPGSKIANSKGQKHLQLFLEDVTDISENSNYLIELFYGKDSKNETKNLVNAFFETGITSEKKKAISKELSNLYPEIADYFDIESTDAQEYTTANEHIEVLWGQGRLSDSEYNTIKEKILKQQEAESNNQKIPKEAILDFAELKLIFQPIKPVQTGFRNEPQFDMMRMMYIKTSSFPLIPQVTKGLDIDGLRKMMESIEKKQKMPVRASYQSGNKVGANKNALKVFNDDGSFNSDLMEDLETSASFDESTIGRGSLLLDRENFRIQQDVPPKFAKGVEVISLGTQTLKLLFGDGMADPSITFDYDGKEMKGPALLDEYNKTWENYISFKRKELYDRIGVDKNGKPLDIKKTAFQLKELLKDEAINRGYPKQDIEALDVVLKSDSRGNIVDVQFNIPLWLSPNSNRYEALLNAIVSNKLAKIKLPGNSYVAGSEAGFTTQTDLTGIDESRIIFTSKWKGKLQAYKKGSLAQVLLPSRFRDNSGELIEFIFKDGTHNPKYVTKNENGSLSLKEEMFGKGLLDLTTFRIPTSSHVSMSQLEIVGILPPEVGDLAILPKNLTKQKGLDFDVDKENSYQQWTYVDPDGVIRPITESDRGVLATMGMDENTISQKIYENSIVRIHSAVLSNTNEAVQNKINKVLSMDFAKSQAELIDSKINKDNVDTFFTILDDSYQKYKMGLGAAGKMGIAIYSNYVVLHSMLQQTSNPITVMHSEPIKAFKVDGSNPEGRKVMMSAPKAYKLRIGNLVSTGVLGSLRTLDGSRTIAEVFAERQNTATDNEKEQIMGRVNVNDITINVDSFLSALGFDKGKLDDGRDVSIPYLLLSQPIIKEYVEEIRKTKSNTSQYDANAEAKVIEQLRLKYKTTLKKDTLDEGGREMLLPQTLFDNLTSPENNVQDLILDIFLEVNKKADTLRGVQSKLSINKNGLGKSFFDTLEKYEGVQKIAELGDHFKNITDLVGHYVAVEDLTNNDIESYEKDGYILVGDYLIKPSNPVGSMLVHTVKAGHDLWQDYFPYDDPALRTVMDAALRMISNEEASANKKVEIRQTIFQEMKKFLYSSSALGVFQGDPQSERYRLFFDNKSTGKISLSSYLNEILLDRNNDIVNEFLRPNRLISRLLFNIESNNLPSTLRFDNNKGESFDEEYLYNAIIELMETNKVLPDFNGKPYSTRDLAADLVSYSFLEGGIQQAVQFSKYIPVSLLNTIDFGKATRTWNPKYNPAVFDILLTNFPKQFAQHNGQKLPKVEMSNIQGANTTKISNVKSFKLIESSFTPGELKRIEASGYVSIYNKEVKKGFNKFQVYVKNGDTYERISSLGVFGLSEYSIKDSKVNSIVNEVTPPVNPQAPFSGPRETSSGTFNIEGGNLRDIVTRISEHQFEDYKHLTSVAKALLDYLPENDIKVKITNVLNANGERIFRGRMDSNSRELSIDELYMRTANIEDLGKTFLHELIHGLTVDYLNQFVDAQGNILPGVTPPKEIYDLISLFNEAKKSIGVDEVSRVATKFQAFKEGRGEPLTDAEREGSYGLTNLKEFVTMIMTEPTLQQKLANVEYGVTGKSLLSRFYDIMDSIMKKILGDSYNKNSVTSQGIAATLSLIEKRAKANNVKTTHELEIERAGELEAILSEPDLTEPPPFFDIAPISENFEDYGNPDENLGDIEESFEPNSSNFVDPFNCK